MERPELSIVIVSYNVKDLLRSALLSVSTYLKDQAEVIVVDNNSNDGSAEMVHQSFPNVKLLKNADNTGFSDANNKGVALASASAVLLLNPDTELTDGSLRDLLKSRGAELSTGTIFAPKLLNSDKSLQKSCWKFPSAFRSVLELFYLDTLFSNGYPNDFFEKEFSPDFASGAALLFSRERYTREKGLDETLFWMEDTDLCYRFRKSGGRVVYVPAVTIIHHSGKSAAGNRRIAISNQLISKLKFFRKHKMYLSGMIAVPAIFFHILSRILLLLPLSLFAERWAVKLDAYFYTWKKYIAYLFLGNSKVTL